MDLVLIIGKDLKHLILDVINLGSKIAETSNIQKSTLKDVNNI